jgi:hypothetical protein
MSQRILSLLALLMLLTGCFASMPPRISDEYLKDLSAGDSAKLETIEKDIIAITDAKEGTEKERRIVDLQLSLIEKEVKQLEAAKAVLTDEQKLYMAQNDKEKLEQTNADIIKNDTGIKNKSIEQEILIAKKNSFQSLMKVKDAELGAKIAERLYEQAKIGRANQDKLMGAPKDEKEAKGRIDVAKYEEYLKSQKESLAKAQKEQDEAAARLKEAEAKLPKTNS